MQKQSEAASSGNPAAPATTHQLIEQLFDAYDAGTLQEAIQAMGTRYMACTDFVCRPEGERYQLAQVIWDFYHLIGALHQVHAAQYSELKN